MIVIILNEVFKNETQYFMNATIIIKAKINNKKGSNMNRTVYYILSIFCHVATAFLTRSYVDNLNK